MILWLDHLFFGSGWGMASPYHDDRYFWLADTSKERGKGNGQIYLFGRGLGAQLTSFQWLSPKPGETRILDGKEFVVFQVRRRWLRVSVTWAMVDICRDDVTTAMRKLTDFEKGLGQ